MPWFLPSLGLQPPDNAFSGLNTVVKQLTKESEKQPEESSFCDKGQNKEGKMNLRAKCPDQYKRKRCEDGMKHIDIDCELHKAWETTHALFRCIFPGPAHGEHGINDVKRNAARDSPTTQH